MVASTFIEGHAENAIGKGFRILARYIFGDTVTGETIKMTAPVRQKTEQKGSIIQFTMPQKYSLDSLPKPKNNAIKIELLPPKRIAALSFRGYSSEERLGRKKKELLDALKKESIKTVDTPIFAGYNSPFAFPLLRHNEILVEIQK